MIFATSISGSDLEEDVFASVFKVVHSFGVQLGGLLMGVSMVITSINVHKLGDKPQKNYGYISYIQIKNPLNSVELHFEVCPIFLRDLEF